MGNGRKHVFWLASALLVVLCYPAGSLLGELVDCEEGCMAVSAYANILGNQDKKPCIAFRNGVTCAGFDSFDLVSDPYEPVSGDAFCLAASPKKQVKKYSCENCKEVCKDALADDTREMQYDGDFSDCTFEEHVDVKECDG